MALVVVCSSVKELCPERKLACILYWVYPVGPQRGIFCLHLMGLSVSVKGSRIPELCLPKCKMHLIPCMILISVKPMMQSVEFKHVNLLLSHCVLLHFILRV